MKKVYTTGRGVTGGEEWARVENRRRRAEKDAQETSGYDSAVSIWGHLPELVPTCPACGILTKISKDSRFRQREETTCLVSFQER